MTLTSTAVSRENRRNEGKPRRWRERPSREYVPVTTTHIVITPKFRHRVLGLVHEAMDECLRRKATEIGVRIVNLAVTEDHVHLHVEIPPRLSLATVVQRLKGGSSREMRLRFPWLVRWCPDGLWTPAYFSSSVGHSPEVVGNYIDKQRGPQEGHR